ncbi:MAG: Na+/H+ antiporter NhaC family protein [Anaerovoracaceae bacterium]
MEYGILSLVPVCIALVLAFVTKDALVSILLGVLAGVVISGQNIVTGFTGILQSALGNADFIWILAIEVFVGIVVAFQKAGALKPSPQWYRSTTQEEEARQFWRRCWEYSYFSDYFSSLYVGNIMRPVTDKAKVSREMLAYICDSTSAPMTSLLPFTSTAMYTAGLLVGIGAIADSDIGVDVVFKAFPFNFYCWITIIMVLLISAGIIPQFGPMRTAEKRAQQEGKVLADNAVPLLSSELESIKLKEGCKSNLVADFFMPAIIIVGISIGTYVILGSTLCLEALVVAATYQVISMLVRRMATLKEIVDTAVAGIKSVMSARLILAMAYCLNAITKQIGTAEFIVGITKEWMTAALLLVISFLVCSLISILTGTSWGTIAIMIPIIIPLAFSVSGGELNTLVYAAVSTVLGGATFGDHCSPISDTTILSSLAAGSDHIAHVKTQIPYALTGAAVASVGYLIIGLTI